MTWSGWQSRRVSTEHQCIYIAKMKNPWTLESDRVLLSKPEFEWERQWINPDGSKTAYTIYVNESPQFYKSRKGDKIFIFYSASGTWTCFYAVGMLMADADSDLLDPDSWTKSTRPVFKQCPENKVYGPGHVSFIPSPDGKEDYLLYDARSVENDPAGSRDSRTASTGRDTSSVRVSVSSALQISRDAAASSCSDVSSSSASADT